MVFPPVKSERLCECGLCHARFVGVSAFDARRTRDFRCVDPAEAGLFLASDGLWSTGERDPQDEAERMRAMRAAKQAQEAPTAKGFTAEQAAPVLQGQNDPAGLSEPERGGFRA